MGTRLSPSIGSLEWYTFALIPCKNTWNPIRLLFKRASKGRFQYIYILKRNGHSLADVGLQHKQEKQDVILACIPCTPVWDLWKQEVEKKSRYILLPDPTPCEILLGSFYRVHCTPVIDWEYNHRLIALDFVWGNLKGAKYLDSKRSSLSRHVFKVYYI